MRRDTKAQMGVDFLIGMLIFAGVLVFVFQFMSTTVAPFSESTGDDTIKVHRVSDELYYDTDKMMADEIGVVDLNYFRKDSFTDMMTESNLKEDLNIRDRSINVTVRVHNASGTNEIAELDEPGKVAIGPDPPNVGASIARATRIGYWEEKNKNVILRVRMW